MFRKLLGFRRRSPGDFPFADAPDTAALACCHVLGGAEILRVTHDAEDGMWQFLCGQAHQPDEARIVSLAEALRLDASVAAAADLPCGWIAERDSAEAAWVRHQR